MKTYNNIDEYIRDYPKDVQSILQKIRQIVKTVAPKGKEAIKYGLPTLILNGKNLVHFGGFKHHIGFYPTPSGTSAFTKELSAYEGGKGSIRFPLDQPIPYPLITKIIKFRVKENTARLKDS